jgi:hypothetical protein
MDNFTTRSFLKNGSLIDSLFIPYPYGYNANSGQLSAISKRQGKLKFWIPDQSLPHT